MLLDNYDTKLDNEAIGYIREIVAACDRMTAFVEAMLELADMQRCVLHCEPVNLSDLFHMALAEFNVKEPERRVEVESAQGVVVVADPRLITAVMENLVGNAWKFTREREVAKIAFGSKECGSETVYYVEDNGAGFDMTQADQLFVPFQRLHDNNRFSGHGIGIATAQKIIERHGGRIWGEGKVGEGATFYFTLGVLV
jgi:light-regulated signal transduction histidine kinase (bacteriophytochrome)